MEEIAEKPSIFAVRTTIGQERSTADMIVTRAKSFGLPLKTVLVPDGIRGYVFIEAIGRSAAERARVGIKHAKGVVVGAMSLGEIEHFLVPKPAVVSMGIGDIVELTSGPFKGERARIVRIDEPKEEITVELFEATVPIPVTVRADFVKIVQRKKEEEK